MHKIVNPKQTQLFDSFDSLLTEGTRNRLHSRGGQKLLRRKCCNNNVLCMLPTRVIAM